LNDFVKTQFIFQFEIPEQHQMKNSIQQYSVGEKVMLPNGEEAPLSKAYRSNDHLFLSGALPFESDGSLSNKGIEYQTTLCLEQLAVTLALEGLTRNNLIKLTIWLTDKNNFAGFNSSYVRFFGQHRPARSTVQSELMLPGALVEIEAIAVY
jgi:2-iminobutanoate/2-iminopropanoate deaminase